MAIEGQGSGGRRPAEDGVDVVAEDTQQAAKGGGGKKGSFWRELPVLIVVAVVLALLIKSFVVQAFYIPSESMEDTLLTNDRVLVNKLVYRVRDIERGDIVVFSGVDSWDPEVKLEEPSNPIAAFFRWVGTAFGFVPGEKDYIKRVIGVPGDKVKCCDAKGRITVNGVPLEEKSYLYPGDVPSSRDFEVTVPKDRLWVMGDHRSVSLDSRSHQGDPGGGTIPANEVIGRAFVIVWPFNRAKILPIPETFAQPALQAAAGAAPAVLGLAGAVPLVALRRRLARR
ncbi:signal peptidase I [Planotetraspora sp. GP83]|uniref:signal peptidase I n=1 Tax=Planotetraspora sp. GP83 TaxID=3156264 RepID=UPI003515D519